LIEELLPVLRTVALELDRHDDRQTPFDAIRVNDSNNPLNCACFL
jgi:hypothetical protein